MKRFLTLALCASLLFGLLGCSSARSKKDNDILFYYLQTEELYRGQDGVITAVRQETLSRTSDIYYLLAFYLNGPTDSRYRSPFPSLTKIISVKEENGHVTVITNSKLASLTGLDLTNACACLALTCMNLLEAEQVSIQYLEENELNLLMELSLEDILLEDQMPNSENGGNE